MNKIEIKISHPPEWPTKTIYEVCQIVSRGTAPVYVDNSAVLAIGQRCVREFGFQPEEARFNDQHSMTRVLEACKGDVLLNSTGTGTIGRSCIFNADGTYIIDGHVTLLRSDPEQLDGRWLNALLQLPQGQLHLETQCYSGSTNQVELSRERLSATSIPVPPLSEQRRIAEILDTIDEAIQKTDALISKLKAMKQGLLHDLLTRGLDKNGKLRDPKTHPEQFKDSPLGRIPHAWNIMAFRDVLAGIIDFRGKTPLKIGMKWGGGDIPALSANNVEMGRINLTKETYYGSKELYQHWMTAGDPAKGDVLMTLEAPLGNVAQIPDDRHYILSQRVVLFKTKDELMDNTFFRYQLTYEPFQCALLSESTGTTAKGIQRAKLEKLLVLVPPRYNEQELIVSKLEAIDIRVSTEEQYRDKLKLQKKGLMHDLLTGKVRVKE